MLTMYTETIIRLGIYRETIEHGFLVLDIYNWMPLPNRLPTEF